MTCLPVRGDDRGRQGASIELLFVCVDTASSAGDEESLPRSGWQGGSFLRARACVFISPTPQKTKVSAVR